MKKYAKQYPKIKFAITDDPVSAIGGVQERDRHHLRDAGGRLPRRRPRGEGGAEDEGGKRARSAAVGGIKIPPVDSYIAGYQYCAEKAVPGTKTIVQYSNSFTDETRARRGAERDTARGPR